MANNKIENRQTGLNEPQGATAKDGMSRRRFLQMTGAAAAAVVLERGISAVVGTARADGTTPTTAGSETTTTDTTVATVAATTASTTAEVWKPTNFLKKPDFNEALKLPWNNSKHQEFARPIIAGQPEGSVLQLIDAGTLGPDVDTIFGIDFPGLLKTGATVVSFPEDGVVTETRVVGIKRTDLDYVQFQPSLGGDIFELYKVKDFGNDHNLDIMAQENAFRSAHTHQMVVYIGDLGKFQDQWGAQEQELLKGMIRAETPSKAGLPLPNFIPGREAAK